MQVFIQSATTLFSLPLQYEIPIYQRPYVWDEDRQWQPLWDDVERTAEDILNPPAQGITDHFMGAIVVQVATQVGAMTKWLVIDGQQRLTTLQILLDAVKLTMRKAGEAAANPANQLLSLVENQSFNYDSASDPHLRFKVWPTAGDQDAYEFAMTRIDKAAGALGEEPRLIRAHHFFEQQAEDWLNKEPEQLANRATALAAAMSQQLKVVAIQLDGNDNPNVIFETLNARGTPLLDWDLTKNYLLHRHQLNGSDSEKLFQTYFKPLEVNEWWREDTARGSAYQPRIDLFLYNWLILRTRRTVDAEKVFPSFTEYAKRRDVLEVTEDLARMTDFYREIERPDGRGEWGAFLPKWHNLQAGVTMPILLWLKEQEAQSALDSAELIRCLLALESFFVRRAVCRLASRGLNRIVTEILSDLADSKKPPADVIIRRLRRHVSTAAEWPSDRSFAHHLVTGKMYRQLTRRRTRIILEGLEHRLGLQNGAVIKSGQTLFIEHLMPQSYLENYPVSSRSIDPDESPQQQRERLLHTLGNLSLTTRKMGIAMSNSGWAKKRDYLRRDTLSLNGDVLQHSGDTWTDQDIIERGKRLADLAIEIWPPPDKI